MNSQLIEGVEIQQNVSGMEERKDLEMEQVRCLVRDSLGVVIYMIFASGY
jgi:hypothetical protein